MSPIWPRLEDEAAVEHQAAVFSGLSFHPNVPESAVHQSQHPGKELGVKGQPLHSAAGPQLFGRPTRTGESAKNTSDTCQTLQVLRTTTAPELFGVFRINAQRHG